MPATNLIPLHVVARAEARDARLQTLGYASYDAYLHSPAWRAVRRRYAEECPWLCNVCGTQDGLQLHHKTYKRVGVERNNDLMPLCERCHQMVHALERRGDVGLDFEGVIDKARALIGRQLLADQQATRQAEDHDHRAAAWARLEALSPAERLRRARTLMTRDHRSDVKRALWALGNRKTRTDMDTLDTIRKIERIVYGNQPRWATSD